MGKFEEQLRFRVTSRYMEQWPNENFQQVQNGVDDKMEMLANKMFELLDGANEWD